MLCHLQTNYLKARFGAKQEYTVKEFSFFRQLVTVKVFALTFNTNVMQESCNRNKNECKRRNAVRKSKAL